MCYIIDIMGNEKAPKTLWEGKMAIEIVKNREGKMVRNGSKSMPIPVHDYSDAFAVAREAGRPIFFIVLGKEIGKAYPSGRWESAE